MTIEELYKHFLSSSGVTTDTRKIEKNQLFFALKGDKFNANTFASEALNQGAKLSIIDEEQYASSEKCILVDDVLETLQNLANYHRKQLNVKVIGLTGSNGKTTNKELLYRALSHKYNVHATKGNLNNHIGVPLTLLSMPAETDMAIIEMGANHQQEIEMLSHICEPNFGFITNIGLAHLEGFGGPEGVKKGKGELFDFLKNNSGIAFINSTDPVLMQMAADKKMMSVVYYGSDDAALKMKSESPFVIFQTPDNKSYTCHISGKYNFDNIQTAFAVAQYFGVESEIAAQALAGYNPDNNRSQTVEIGSNSFLMDAYNANPSSMTASVTNFGKLQTTKQKIVILGDMFELGDYAIIEHEKLGELVANQSFEIVVLYGENMKSALKYLPNAFYFTDKFSLHNWLADRAFSNSYVLIKGSRGVGLESVLEIFKKL